VDPLDVPAVVRHRAMANGRAGQEWLAALPDLVGELARRWALTLGPAMAGGTASFVAPAVGEDGRACVLKIAMPLDLDGRLGFVRSVRAHQLAAGRGCVALLAHDDDASAMLLERLGPNLHELALPLDSVLDRIADTLLAYWRHVDAADASGLRSGSDQAQWLAGFIERTWSELGRPCERIIVDCALALCERRAAAFEPARAVLVHGDAHGWNTLDAGDGTAKFVDPEGLWSEREHDLAVAMREYNEPLLAGDTARLVRDRAEHLAARCHADPESVWEWGYIERVSTGLANVRDFDGDAGLAFLEVAARSR
jgi:streptomycin 6-kinase